MVSEQLVLRGVGGMVDGETFFIDYGETVIIGRSSECDISLKRCEKYLLLDPEDQDSEKHFQTVSRKQVRISFYNATSIEVEDLSSSNGTFLDGEQIKKVVINDIKDNPHELLLGTREKFEIEWSSGVLEPQEEVQEDDAFADAAEDEEDDDDEYEVAPALVAEDEADEEIIPRVEDLYDGYDEPEPEEDGKA